MCTANSPATEFATHTGSYIFIDNKTFKQCHSFYRHVLSKFFAAAEVSLLNSFQVSSTH